MRVHITILFLLLTMVVFGQTKFDRSQISKGTNKIVKGIKKVNIVMSSAVGYAGVRTEQYNNFIKLKERATVDELMELTNHPNSAVRCYAFWALSYNHSINLFPIVLAHINDTAYVYTQFGCIGGGEAVGDFFISVVTPGRIDLSSKKLDSIQLTTLDSILIYTQNTLWAKSRAINRAEPTENLYLRIRELVIKDGDQAALVILAKYQKEEDVELIINNREESKFEEGGFFYTYKAISQFPHPEFLPLLEKNLQKTLDNTHFSTEWRELYKAIASYKNEKAKELLLVPFTQVKHNNIRTYHIDFVFNAVQEFKTPIYNDLLWKLWEEEDRINLSIYQYLSEIDSIKALELTRENLKNTSQLSQKPESLIVTMLELILKLDTTFGLEVIKTNIKKANVHIFPLFADKADQLKHPSFIEPLFARLETEWNAHIYLEIVKTLIAFDDIDINQRILATRKINENLNKEWGGVALDKLLEENNIK